MKLPISLPKRVKSSLAMNSNNSHGSLPRSSTDSTSHDSFRSSQDTSRPSYDSARSVEVRRRGSLDALRALDTNRPSFDDENLTARSPPLAVDPRFNSVRSILRDPKTPGTGQNVRFFSRDAYKVISPEQSTDVDYQQQPTSPPPPPPQQLQEPLTFLERLSRSSPDSATSPGSAFSKSSSSSKSSRPSVVELFSPQNNKDKDLPSPGMPGSSKLASSLMRPLSPPNFGAPLDGSNPLELLPIPIGLQFDISAPLLESPLELDTSSDEHGAITSTPARDKGKAKERPRTSNGSVDETIFHSTEKAPKLPNPLHDRSQSFSFGQTVFFSMNASDKKISPEASEHNSESISRASSSASKHRSRALSDTVFQNMLRGGSNPPEADIHDTSSPDLYSQVPEPTSEPDPFSANANTYYGPQTMIPVTPPQGIVTQHVRKTSKEENIIFSLQTQLTLQTELCSQYETDLRARDELVDMLTTKLTDFEKEEAKRKNVLRQWKKKVAELEKTCRYLQEEVEGSRQESMERSIMDEASGEALRMLHRQIAGLERERTDWQKKEEALRDEIQTLEGLIKDRSQDVQQLNEALWSREETERELKQGLRDAQEQIEMLGHVSVVVDEEEMKKFVLDQEKNDTHRVERERVQEEQSRKETEWSYEKEELMTRLESFSVAKGTLEATVEELRQQLKAREDEYAVIQSELEAQWTHTEKTSEQMQTLQREKDGLKNERDDFERDVKEAEVKIANMELEWNESENKKNELEQDIQELWDHKEALEKEKEELEAQLHQEQSRSDELSSAVQEREDRITELDQERQFAVDNVERLQENLRKRDQELTELSQRVIQREHESESLKEEMSNMKREHNRIVEEQVRALKEVSGQEGQTKSEMEVIVKQKAEVDIELHSMKDRVTGLQQEIDKLRRQVHDLQQESADKEVRIVQLTKQKLQDKEDLNGLNIALDSKQQELELLKRRLGVRGTAGSTPAQPSKVAVHHRRDSSIFTNTPGARPPSAMSDGRESVASNRERRSSGDAPTTSAKIAALGKSIRANGTSSSGPSGSKVGAMTRAIDGALGHPPVKGRPSTAGTPTSNARTPSMGRLSSSKPATPSSATPMPHRRVASAAATAEQSTPSAAPSTSSGTSMRAKLLRQAMSPPPLTSSSSESEEKENVDLVKPKRRSLVPAPA
ncbi:hypothetical protein BDN72DRAFT_817280 [Pluteus cervinus]|uniref:Uncharacterized protein n=1 Tax=Pluteus cervinus TaxID=181527 RepID=A0ACD3B182_9AGAR|nr:hypothetical protein BDN72DRAFT_817280 [Pluteus cervinus]